MVILNIAYLLLLVEHLFETLSRCASLHPSTTEEGEESGFGNPFSSIGPFGTGISNLSNGDERNAELQNDGAFEDAEEDNGTAGSSIYLSDSGRVRNDYQTPDNRFRPY